MGQYKLLLDGMGIMLEGEKWRELFILKPRERIRAVARGRDFFECFSLRSIGEEFFIAIKVKLFKHYNSVITILAYICCTNKSLDVSHTRCTFGVMLSEGLLRRPGLQIIL